MSNFKLESKKLPKLIIILGPTASGKTEWAIKLAKEFDGEIVSADSRQVYKEMNIATAKPMSHESTRIDHEFAQIVKGITHYLIDIIYPNEEFNVAIYKKMALKAIKGIQKRGKVPFLVGGTGLYIQAIVDNIEFPKIPAQKRLRKKLEKKSARELFEIYKKLDPEGAKLIDRENKRRLIRAIEVCKVTKKSFWQQRKKGAPLFDVLQIGIKLPKKELKKRISKRVKKMIKQGLENEVKKLVKKYGWIPPLQTIGYQEWSAFAEASADEKDYFSSLTKKQKREIKEKIVLHTLQFAKRQITWFKRDRRIHWIKNYQQAENLIRKFLQI